jgi:DNA polymerase III delta prime subunit
MKDIVASIGNMISSGNLPHFIFYGDAGTGKTSMAYAIANEVFGDGSIGMWELNASKYEGLNFDRICGYAMTAPLYRYFVDIPFKGEPFKILLLDEADGMTPRMQESLKRLMEECGHNCKFILTCNDIGKIIRPIQSRCKKFSFTKPTDEELYLHLKMIARKEKAKINDSIVRRIAETSDGDIRQSVLNLQCSCS